MMTDPAPRFGDLLRRQRRAAGLTQEELADRAGVSPRTIGDIERGIARSYRHETVHLLADALCLAPGERDAFEASAFVGVATLPLIPVARPATMPSQATSFLGRDKALHEVTALLRRGPRLVTLVGPPGVGKTRLALAATATLSPGYPGAVVVTGLAPVAYAEGILPAIAASFGVSQADGTPLLTALIEHLRPRRAFLMLDNAEHVAVALAALVTDLMAGCPGLRVLTTSRSALNVPGEHTFVVAPLDLPPPEEVDPDALARSPAVALFVERARAVVPSFALSPAVARDVAAACRRLDGLPLAIELAAAWANVVRPGDMASRLPSLLALPLGPEGARPGRQHSLWRAVAWSVDLLGPREQRLYRRLGVFAGGAGLSSVEAVCTDALADDDDDDDENGRRSVRAGLSALVDANLVRLEPDARAGDVQVGMMETIRAHAADLLETSGEGEQVRQRHTAHYLAMVEAAEGGLRGQDQELWMARLGAEHDNLRAVLRRAVRAAEHRVAGLRIAGLMWRYWLMHGHLSEGRGWLDRLLARADVDTPPTIRADACNGAGVLAHSQGDYTRAEALLEDGLALRRRANDTWGVTASLTNLGNVALDRGDFARATALHEDALAIKRELGDIWAISISLNNLGELAREQGDYQRAAAYHEESLTLKRQLGDAWGITASLHNLGQIALIQGDRDQARALHTEVLAMAREMGDKRVIALSLYGVATTLTDDTTTGERMALYHQSLELYREVGDRVAVAACLEGLAAVAIDQGDPQRATWLSATAATARVELGAPLAVDEQPMRERTLTAARSALGDDTFASAWVKGQVMTMDEAAETSLGLA